MDKRRIRGLKARVGWECGISRGGARFNNGGIQAGGVREGSHNVTMRFNGRSHSGGSHNVTSRDAAGGSSRSESCQEF